MAEEIRAEMVANVWKVVASAGDAVAAGDTLVILESMKMEIPVLAEDGGTLAELAVNEGDVVQEGDLIARARIDVVQLLRFPAWLLAVIPGWTHQVDARKRADTDSGEHRRALSARPGGVRRFRPALQGGVAAAGARRRPAAQTPDP